MKSTNLQGVTPDVFPALAPAPLLGQKVITETEMVIGPGQGEGGVLIILVHGDTQFSRLLTKEDALSMADGIRELAMQPDWKGE